MDNRKDFTVWPDLSKDMDAWKSAKAQLGEKASVRDLVAKAIQIKEALKREQTA